MSDQCPICFKQCHVSEERIDYFFNCNVCGPYVVERNVYDDYLVLNGEFRLEDDDRRFVLSHVLKWKYFYAEKPSDLKQSNIVKYLSTKLPNPSQRMDNFILWLGTKSKDHGDKINISEEQIMAIMGSSIRNSKDELIKRLIDKDFINNVQGGTNIEGLFCKEYWLTLIGWEYFEQLKKSSHHTKKAFMAMKFSDEMKAIFNSHFKPAVKATGYDLETVIETSKAGSIESQSQS
jgi:hypothetical protein